MPMATQPTSGIARLCSDHLGPEDGAAPGSPSRFPDWRGDVALELWVEGAVQPARVRLAGRLDATTAANLHDVIADLIASGSLNIELCTEGLRAVDASALGTLADVERVVCSAGGTLTRIAPASGPFSRSRIGLPLHPMR